MDYVTLVSLTVIGLVAGAVCGFLVGRLTRFMQEPELPPAPVEQVPVVEVRKSIYGVKVMQTSWVSEKGKPVTGNLEQMRELANEIRDNGLDGVETMGTKVRVYLLLTDDGDQV